MKRFTISGIIILLAIVGLLLVRVHANSPKPPVTHVQAPVASVTPKPITRADLLAAVNAERGKYGVAPLVEDPRLDASAQQKADDECTNNYIAHVNPVTGVRGRDLAVQALNNLYGNYDENLTQPTPVTVSQAMYNWDNSKPHHDGIINADYTLTGFGFCKNEVVEHFYGPAN